ncbi:MAG: hypothetical protein WCF24_09555 [Acidimicrobiales bacterium]
MNAPAASGTPTLEPPLREVRISILHVPDCPSVSRLRADLERALERTGTTAVIDEIEGAHSSPTLLINGTEVDGYPAGTDPACRIDLPTQEQIAAVILAACAVSTDSSRTDGDSA